MPQNSARAFAIGIAAETPQTRLQRRGEELERRARPEVVVRRWRGNRRNKKERPLQNKL